MNTAWKSGASGGRDPFSAYICDDAALDALRPIVIEMGWQPEKCNKGGLRNAVQSLCSGQPQHSDGRPVGKR